MRMGRMRVGRMESIVAKKIWVFALLFFLLAVPVTAYGAEAAASVAADWTTQSYKDGLVIRGYKGKAADLTIPSAIGKKKVLCIGKGAFAGNKTIKKITVPSSVTKIGEEAFRDCSALKKVTLEKGVSDIGASAFEGCTSLKNLKTEEGLKKIGKFAFYKCPSIEYIWLPSSVKEIGEYALGYYAYDADPASDEGYLLSRTFKLEGESAAVNKYVIANEINQLHYGNFKVAGQTGITAYTHRYDGKVIYHEGLERAVIYDGKAAKPKVQSNWDYLKEGRDFRVAGYSDNTIYTNNAVVKLEGLGYYKGSSMETYFSILPQRPEITKLKEKNGHVEIAFTEVEGVSYYEIVCKDGRKDPVTKEDYRKVFATEQTSRKIYGLENGISYTVEVYGVVEHPEFESWYENRYIYGQISKKKTIRLSEQNDSDTISDKDGDISWEYADGKLTVSGSGAMPDYKEGNAPWNDLGKPIRELVVKKGIMGAGKYAFSHLDELTTASLPKGLKQLGDYSFYSCSKLSSIQLPSHLKKVGAHAFQGCRKLASVELPDSLTAIGSQAFRNCKGLEEISVPSGITEIKAYTFNGCTGIKKVKLPDTAKKIGHHAFKGCTKLEEINIPSGVTVISKYAFMTCWNLKSITLPKSVKTIEDFALSYTGLQEILLPSNLQTIGQCAFRSCQLTSVVIPDSVETIGYAAFQNCRNLKEITIPASVRHLSKCLQECGKVTIYGSAGSAAEKLAASNDKYTFVLIK